MGYYDPPEVYETEIDFTCKECDTEHENAEATHTGKYSEQGIVTCAECGHEQEVDLRSPDYCECNPLRCLC